MSLKKKTVCIPKESITFLTRQGRPTVQLAEDWLLSNPFETETVDASYVIGLLANGLPTVGKQRTTRYLTRKGYAAYRDVLYAAYLESWPSTSYVRMAIASPLSHADFDAKIEEHFQRVEWQRMHRLTQLRAQIATLESVVV